jgi:hypothetical protein
MTDPVGADQIDFGVTARPASKPWWKSKTIWLNAAGVAIDVGTYAASLPLPLPVTAGINIANIVLRAVTSRPVHFGSRKRR